MRADVVELGTVFCVHRAPETVNMGLGSTWHNDRVPREMWQPGPDVVLISIKRSYPEVPTCCMPENGTIPPLSAAQLLNWYEELC